MAGGLCHHRHRHGISRQPKDYDGQFRPATAEDGDNIAWWLRLKGVRDVVAGLAVLAFLAWGSPRDVGLLLLVEALIPIGDMSLVLAAKGSKKTALTVHAPTAILMALAAVILRIGAS